MVKVYVELVWDIHFPGKITGGERKGRKKRREGKIFSVDTKWTKHNEAKKKNVNNNVEKIDRGHSTGPERKPQLTLAPPVYLFLLEKLEVYPS